MKKIISLMLSLIMVLVLTVGCTNSNEEAKKEESTPSNIKVVTPAGTPTLSMIKMFKENPHIGDNISVSYESVKSTDLLTSKILSKEADIFIVPTNLAANLYNKNSGYKIATSTVWGTFYLVGNEKVSNWDDLKGKEIDMIGRGLTPDAIFRYLLIQNNIDPDKDVKLNYFGGASELATNFISGKSDLSLMPEPMLTKALTKRSDSRVLIDLQKDWEKATKLNSSYPQASLIVSEELINNHPDAVKSFLGEYKKSVNWVNQNPSEAGEYYEELNMGLTKMIVEKSIKRCNIEYVSAKDAKESIDKYLNVLFEYNSKLVGGKLVDEDFYFTK
ncbi:MAG: ABC transporter substrate-binding protein [Tepidibacter sp.]|jgi:NitT/TauT family transport system substrate-binding protein|uniref:ABC transporter substrate-binding protein n=1 Tax=Tepidibacter sp. TaxID=2529387 RepID=UPI0025D756EF|nr:ABC transporter substrate-binding protein [Tepidibacter sp.]MCT4509971.1 ABC transporter substrate-binding protein [Tepidibacter sp.]